MRILTDNLLLDASLSMTNPSSTYPVANVVHPFKAKVAKSSGITTVVTGSFALNRDINCACIGNHNCISVVVKLYNSSSTLLATFTNNAPVDNDIMYFATTYANVASITFTCTSISTLAIGALSCGKYVQVYNLVSGYEVEYEDTSSYEQSQNGQVTQYAGTILRSFGISLININAENRGLFQDAYGIVLKGFPFWLDQYEGVVNTIEPPIFGYFTESILEVNKQGLYSLSTSFKEAK